MSLHALNGVPNIEACITASASLHLHSLLVSYMLSDRHSLSTIAATAHQLHHTHVQLQHCLWHVIFWSVSCYIMYSDYTRESPACLAAGLDRSQTCVNCGSLPVAHWATPDTDAQSPPSCRFCSHCCNDQKIKVMQVSHAVTATV